ncbi:conserved hypothetical protein [Theileria equi strain WA]|uniref:Uncharacterized protein n=1 Tax=Theileria equi strain WA TaxID=1537102 RepID=L1LA28_THEEQ|nr:conserved hypothetical protein [Theileria equi strain WA]EKX72282.1 conserved hypothetical protein [Theileria equi strain WA]|eukprot:XP_004831734.1 conserved hypothetical protein [Theileria equi strain WA]
MSKEGEETNNRDRLRKFTAFLSGLALYQLPHIAFSASRYTLVRFQVPSAYVGLFINRMIISSRIFSLITIGLATMCDQFGMPGIIQVGKASVIFLAASLSSILFVYCIGGEQGYLTLYYWTISISSMVLGASFVFVVKIVSKEIVYLMAALPITGIVVSSYHLAFLMITNYITVSDIPFWIVFWQIIIGITIVSLTVVMLYSVYDNDKPDEGKEKKTEESKSTEKTDNRSTGTTEGSTGGNTCTCVRSDSEGGTQECKEGFMEAVGKAWSPLLLVALGYGLQNAFYPGIAPYKLTTMTKGYNIELTVLFTSAIPPLVIIALKEKKNNIAPNVSWKEYPGWHWSWLFFLCQMLCAVIFLWCLHFPGWSISKAVKGSMALLGFLTVTYDFCAQCTRNIGTSGASMQGCKENSRMDTLNSFSYSFSQVIFAFLGDGYLRVYSKYEKDRSKWPTKHYGNFRAFRYWIWTATKVSFGNIGTAFTTDVRGAIQTKKEFLFIVYEDEMDNSSEPPKTKNPTVMKIVHDI